MINALTMRIIALLSAKRTLLTGLTLAVLTFISSCKKDKNTSDVSFSKRSTKASYTSASALPVQTVSGSITSNTTWDNSRVWEVSGVLVVKCGATLTIEPGTYIKSTVINSLYPNGVIVIQKGAKISAIGTADHPIVFTSRYKLGDVSKSPASGDFGGIILLGNAPVNVADKTIEGLPGNDFPYGGTDSMDNSGVMQYVRIEYAGFILSNDNEVNSLTCGGVGSGTTLDHIEASYSLDDSFEFFGGKVNASYLISKAPQDDNFDFDNGYRGQISFALAIADKNSLHSQSGGNSDSHGIESDNNALNETPDNRSWTKTHPKLRNITIIGTSAPFSSQNQYGYLGYRYGIRNRRGAQINLYNSIVTGYPSGIVFDDGTLVFYTADISKLEGNDVHGFNAAVSPAGAYPGNILSTSLVASKFYMEQPFFNEVGPLIFWGPEKGAFTSDDWAAGWSTI